MSDNAPAATPAVVQIATCAVLDPEQYAVAVLPGEDAAILTLPALDMPPGTVVSQVLVDSGAAGAFRTCVRINDRQLYVALGSKHAPKVPLHLLLRKEEKEEEKGGEDKKKGEKDQAGPST